MKRTGITDIPLHYGRAPAWLFTRMRELAREITIAIVTGYGAEELLRKIVNIQWGMFYVVDFKEQSDEAISRDCHA